MFLLKPVLEMPNPLSCRKKGDFPASLPVFSPPASPLAVLRLAKINSGG